MKIYFLEEMSDQIETISYDGGAETSFLLPFLLHLTAMAHQ
jgi:hypothetical protein